MNANHNKVQFIFFPVFTGVCVIAEKNIVSGRVTNKGSISLNSKKYKKDIFNVEIPFLRGIEYFVKSLYFFFLFLFNNLKDNNSKTFSFSSFQKILLFCVLIVSVFVFSVVLLGLIPNLLGFYLINTNSVFFKKLGVASFKVLIFISAFLIFKTIPALKKLYRFNGAIAALVLNEKKERPINFLNVFYIAALILLFTTTIISIELSFGLNVLINLLIMFFSFALSYEFNSFFSKKHKKGFNVNKLCDILSVLSPGKTELEVVKSVFAEGVLMIENENRLIIEDKEEVSGKNFSFVLGEVKEVLEKNNINDFGEAEWLIANVLKCKKLDLKLVKNITKTQYKEIQKALLRRIKGEPIDKIFGFTEFYGLKIIVNKNVLTPRQETELLVEEVLKVIGSEKLNVLDLCTGSGAIAVALSKNSFAKVLASDISEDALQVAKQNAEENKVKIIFKNSNLFDKLKTKKFDIIVSNPPYIKSEDIKNLDKEVKNHDPILALDGGVDGLDFYRDIIKDAPKHLNKNGKLFLEVGFDQANKVKKLLTENFVNVKIIKDYNAVPRIVVATKKKG